MAAYSTQSDKVINSGEGGFITTSDDDIAARAIFLSGAYEQRYCKWNDRGSWHELVPLMTNVTYLRSVAYNLQIVGGCG